MKPTLREVIDHVREHYGLSMEETIALLRTPLHPTGLRDEFAGRALQGICSGPGHFDRLVAAASENMVSPQVAVASAAYSLADAMLTERGEL